MNLDDLQLMKESEGVYRTTTPVSIISQEHLALIKRDAESVVRKRARICLHPTNHSPLHEMFIALSGKGYVKPHKHLKKSESFHLVEGDIAVILFDDNGHVTQSIRLSTLSTRYYRLEAGTFHTIIVLSELAVIHEVTDGPFVASETEYADFAPDEDASHAGDYLKSLTNSYGIDRY
jgi:cupin fold WbuC family metalloprotein